MRGLEDTPFWSSLTCIHCKSAKLHCQMDLKRDFKTDMKGENEAFPLLVELYSVES